MASEAPRSAGQGRQGRQPKTKGAASSLGTRQDKTTPPAKVEQRAMQMAGFLTQDKTSREEWTVAESGAQDALVVSSKKEIGCGEGRASPGAAQGSTARSPGAGRLNDHRTDRTGATRVPYQCRCWCTAVSVLCESVRVSLQADAVCRCRCRCKCKCHPL
jgi:hypothetical protein